MSNKYIVKVNDIDVEVSKEVYELVEVFNNELTLVQQENQQLCNEIDIWNDKYNAVDRDRKQYYEENQQLKEENKDIKRTIELFSNSLYNCDLKRYKSLLDEIREQLKLERKLALSLNKPYTVSVIDKLLDKVKEGSNND